MLRKGGKELFINNNNLLMSGMVPPLCEGELSLTWKYVVEYKGFVTNGSKNCDLTAPF